MSALDIAAIRAAHPVSSVLAGLKLKRAGREWVSCCPFHEDRTPSFTVNDDKGFAHCFGCGWHGDVLDVVQALHTCSLREAAERLGSGTVPTIHRTSPRGEPAERNSGERAAAIWERAEPIAGTPAALYLERRALWLMRVPDCLRFARLKLGKVGPMPCLIAQIVDVDGSMIGIQRTYLTEEGRKADLPDGKVKFSLGRVSGGAIRLAPVAAELIVTEGLEDGLTLQQEMGRAVWVAAGSSMLPSMQFPPEVKLITIGSDNDEAGQRSAAKAAESFGLEGRSVRIIRPLPGCKDFSDELNTVILK